VFASPERKKRINVQDMLNEIHSRPSMAGVLGTGIVSALSAKTLSETQTNKPLEVRANLDRIIRSKLQEVCSVKDDIIQSLEKKLESLTVEAERLAHALEGGEVTSKRKIAELEEKLQEALLVRQRNVDDECVDLSPTFASHATGSMNHQDNSRPGSFGASSSLISSEADKTSLHTSLGLYARSNSDDVAAYNHAQGTSLAPQLRHVAPVIAAAIEQVHKARRHQKPIEGSVIVTHTGEVSEGNDAEIQRQALRRRMTKSSKTSEAIESTTKALMNVVALEDVTHGAAEHQPMRPILSTHSAATSAAHATISSIQSKRNSVLNQASRNVVSAAGEEPLPIDLFLENQQRSDFMSHVTTAMTMLPLNLCQDFISEILRQVSCFGAGLALASEAVAVLSAGDHLSALYEQASVSLQRLCRVHRVQLFEVHWDSRSLVPIIDGHARERDDFGISQRIPIGLGYVGKCVHMGPQIVNYPASLGQDFQPTDRGEGAVAATMLALPIGMVGQPPIMVASLINKLLPLGTPQQSQLEALQKGKHGTISFGAVPKQRSAPANADKPPFGDADVVLGMAVGYFIAQKAMRCRLLSSMAQLQNGMMARACAMGGAGFGSENVMNCLRSQELCAAVLSEMRAAANWSCIDLMLVVPGPPVPLIKGTSLQSSVHHPNGHEPGNIVFGNSNIIIHIIRDEVVHAFSNLNAPLSGTQTGAPSKPSVKAVSEVNLSQLQAQLATQWLPQTFRRAATLETKSLLQTQSQLLNQIVCITVSEKVVPTEVGTDYALVQNLENPVNGAISSGENVLPLTGVQEIVKVACSENARGIAQCSIQEQALFSSLDSASGCWTLRYTDKNFIPNARLFGHMESSSSGVAASARPFNVGASNCRHCVFMPVKGAGGTVVALLRAEKYVQAQNADETVAAGGQFSADDLTALSCIGQHCGSILQVFAERKSLLVVACWLAYVCTGCVLTSQRNRQENSAGYLSFFGIYNSIYTQKLGRSYSRFHPCQADVGSRIRHSLKCLDSRMVSCICQLLSFHQRCLNAISSSSSRVQVCPKS
jgi:hypothetical protein